MITTVRRLLARRQRVWQFLDCVCVLTPIPDGGWSVNVYARHGHVLVPGKPLIHSSTTHTLREARAVARATAQQIFLDGGVR